MKELRKFGPMAADNTAVGRKCEACSKPFKAGDYTTLIALGPGDDPEEQEKARSNRPYNSVAIQVHYSCATGIID